MRERMTTNDDEPAIGPQATAPPALPQRIGVKIGVRQANARAPNLSRGADFLILCGFRVVTPPGFEPGTNGLKVHCSAVELEGRAESGRSKARSILPRHSPDMP
jgi:hypothetical protein